MDRKKAIALSFSVPVAWGFSYPLMKIGMDSMNATSIVALRCIIAFAACLLLFHKRAFRINRDLMVRAAIIGAIMATELTCMCLGSSLTSASTAGFLQSLTVVIVPFANAALLRRAPERKVLVGTAIVTCGMLLLSGADFTSLNPGAIIMLLVGCMLLIALVVNPIIVFVCIRKNPYPLVLRCLKDSGITAFFTRSSAANIPVNMELCQNLGLNKDNYSVSIPLGATINMAGAAVTISIMTMATVHLLGIQVDFPTAVVLSILSAVGACGASGVAGG